MLPETGICIRLQVIRQGVGIKLEISPVLRGTLFPAVEKELHHGAQEMFGYAKAQLLSVEDIYGGKICAALDRQHPRDLFDIHHLLISHGITEEIKNAFLVYLISHNRPMAELLAPIFQSIDHIYNLEFKGMTVEPVALETLMESREKMVAALHRKLTARDRDFLVSFKKVSPKWELFSLPGAESLPGVKWKLYNLSRMSGKKHKTALAKLEKVLEV